MGNKGTDNTNDSKGALSTKHRGRGEGPISSRADKKGNWRGYVSMGIGADGKEKRKWIYGKTRREVLDRLNDLLHDHKRGINIAPAYVTVGAFLYDWLENVKRRSISTATYISYEVIIRKHLVPSLGHLALQQLSAEDVDRYITYKVGRGMSGRSVQYQIALLRSALKVAIRRDLVFRNVAEIAESPRVEQKEMHALTLEQASTLLESLGDHRLRALYTLMLTLELRRSEALGLRWVDVDLKEGKLTVRRGLQRVAGELRLAGVKTEQSKRTLHLNASLVDLLRQ